MLCPIGNFFYYLLIGRPVERELGLPKGFRLGFGWTSNPILIDQAENCLGGMLRDSWGKGFRRWPGTHY
jgi:hypothetical protein